MRRLAVYNNDVRAGILTEAAPGKGYSFIYDDEYLATDLPPVSLTLPKRRDSFESEQLFPFFANMLPEGANRKVICRSLRIDEQDFFGLLSAMAGKDFIGAVSVRNFEDE